MHLISYIVSLIAVSIASYTLVRSPTRRGWLTYGFTVFATALSLLVLASSCKPKAKPVPTITNPAPTVDSTRVLLQNKADTSRTRADRAAQSSQSTVTDYENDLKAYDSIPDPLP